MSRRSHGPLGDPSWPPGRPGLLQGWLMGQGEVGRPGAGSPELLGKTPDQTSVTDEGLLGVGHPEPASDLLHARVLLSDPPFWSNPW